jgi:hydrogenase maturation protein HypF
MAENGVSEPTIGLILDGMGHGPDGTIWGGEVLAGSATGYARLARLEHLALPGGEAAIREPWRVGVSALLRAYGEGAFRLDLPIISALAPGDVGRIQLMIDRSVNTPVTSSAGRLFDAVAAILGIRSKATYEAQAAIELEMTADGFDAEPWPDCVASALSGDGPSVAGPERARLLGTTLIVRRVVEEALAGSPVGAISAQFHATFAALLLEGARYARELTGIDRVGLSGGVFQNMLLFERLCVSLETDGFEVLTHSKVPSNDGGLAYGQAVVAAATLARAKNGRRK